MPHKPPVEHDQAAVERAALRRATRPRVAGRLIETTDDGLLLDCGGCLIEVAHGDVVERISDGQRDEVTLRPDAALVVSVAYDPGRQIVTERVFGALIDHGLMSDNCNCNCNCGGGNCNCNCNCACDCTECSVCTGSIVQSPLAERSFFRRRVEEPGIG